MHDQSPRLPAIKAISASVKVPSIDMSSVHLSLLLSRQYIYVKALLDSLGSYTLDLKTNLKCLLLLLCVKLQHGLCKNLII